MQTYEFIYFSAKNLKKRKHSKWNCHDNDVLLRGCRPKFDFHMRYHVLFIIIFFFSIAFSQSAFEADAFFNKRQYPEAAKIYASLLEKQPQDPLFNYRLARCNYELKEYDNAIKYFIAGGSRYPLRDYYLADSYFQSYQFKEAIEFYQNYMKSPATNAVFLRDVDQKLKKAILASEMMKNIAEIELVDSIQCNRDEFIKHYSLSPETGTIHLQSVTIPRKGQINLVSFVTQSGDTRYYSDTLVSSVNIYKSSKLTTGWSSGELIRSFSNGDENYPFVTGNGLKLFFASNGDHAIGGYDIFSAHRNNSNESFHSVVNLGFPFNSIYNDYMLVVDEVSGIGWFVTDRFQPADKVMIYQFVYNGNEDKYAISEDVSHLRELAMLKKSVKPGIAKILNPVQNNIIEQVETVDPKKDAVHVPQTKPAVGSAKPEVTLRTPSKQIYLEINDDIVYTNANQFRSAKALQAWNEYTKFGNELETYEARLLKIRGDYENATERVEKLRLTNEISSLEKAVVRLKLQVVEKIKMARNEEIIVLMNQQLK